MGTLVSTWTLPFWIEPLGLYRHGLKRRVRTYFARYFCYLSVTVLAGLLTGLMCTMVGGAVPGFLVRTALCLVIPNGVYLAAYRRTEEFRFVRRVLGDMVRRMLLTRI